MKRVESNLQKLEPRALYLHCYDHSLNLAVSDTLKGVNCMDNVQMLHLNQQTVEIFSKKRCHFSEVSSRTDNINSGHTKPLLDCVFFFPESIGVNYSALEAIWDEALDVCSQSEVLIQPLLQLKIVFYQKIIKVLIITRPGSNVVRYGTNTSYEYCVTAHKLVTLLP